MDLTRVLLDFKPTSDPLLPSKILVEGLQAQAYPFILGTYYVLYDHFDIDYNRFVVNLWFQEYPEFKYKGSIDRDDMLDDEYAGLQKVVEGWGEVFRSWRIEPEDHIHLGEN